jgi:molybdopterin converting factor small subunit
MRVRVQFYSYFKELAGCATTEEDLPAPSTVEDLLGRVHERFPRLAGFTRSTLVAVGVEYQGRDYVLQEGDEVSLFPPVQGG